MMTHAFDRFAARASAAMVSLAGFCVMVGFTGACLLLGLWLGWVVAQILLTTALTVMTQLTAMLIQRQTGKQEQAMQTKLDEMIGAIEGADNQVRGIEKSDLAPTEGP